MTLGDTSDEDPASTEAFSLKPVLLAMPGFCWAWVLIVADMNAAEGWWLIGLTIATGATIASQTVRPDADWLMSTLITITIVAVIAACFVREPDGVMYAQPFLLGLCVVASNRSLSKVARVVAIVLAMPFVLLLVVMLLGAMGMSH
jgi:hypothetical protein